MVFAEKTWPIIIELNPEIFSNNIIVPYVVSMMEDFLKSTYIALLRYSEKKQAIFKGARLSGEQLANISAGLLTVEEAVAEMMAFQRISVASRHFRELDPKIDIAGALKKPFRRRKQTLFEYLDDLTTRRHALIHGIHIDISLRGKKIDALVGNVAAGTGRIYRHVTEHHGWFKQLALLWHFRLGCKEHVTVRTLSGWRSCEEVEDRLPDGRHAWLWWRS